MISSLPHLTVRRGVQSRFASSSRRKHTEYYTSSILSVSVDSPLSRPTERPASIDSSCDLLWPPTLTVTLNSTPGLPAPTPYTNVQMARSTGTHTAGHAVHAVHSGIKLLRSSGISSRRINRNDVGYAAKTYQGIFFRKVIGTNTYSTRWFTQCDRPSTLAA